KEAQELLFQLGGTWHDLKTDIRKIPYVEKYLFLKDGLVTYGGWESYSYHCGQELTLPKLRDLVVLKLNDVKDANRHAERGGEYFITSDGNIYFWMNKWVKSTLGSTETLQTVETIQPQDPSLISGADAMIAAIDGKDVEYEWIEGSGNWRSFNDEEWSAEDLKSGEYRFRLKPTTLTVNAELPKPHKETQHNSLVYAITYEFKTREERNAFADKLRGTNS
ncbi:hypothetical protein, partial [Acinetobacter calcoaceticus]|uniref:hypothetical protein n=1 Tax=Acinetobacter calcoaceticus TaxID=471 RepID=UPI0018DDDC38